MGIRRWWHSLSFYWQIYLTMVAFIGALVLLIEMAIEPAITGLFFPAAESKDYLRHDADLVTYLEATLWFIGVITPSLLVCLLVLGMIRRKLDSMLEATQRLAGGDLSARVPDSGAGKDVFSLLSRNFNHMADSLEQAHRNEKRIMADISHELRSPLTRIGVAASILDKDRHADDFDSTMEMLENDLDHMNQLVEILLIQGRNRVMNSGTPQAVDMSELVLDMAEKFNVLGRDDRKRFEAEAEPKLLAYGYDLKARMALENILSNALFYMPCDSTVEIRARSENSDTVITVRDRGPGVPEEDLVNIFRHFYRTDASRTRDSGGVGLGLAIVKETIIEMRGSVKARNTHPGLEVQLCLPSCPMEENVSNKD